MKSVLKVLVLAATVATGFVAGTVAAEPVTIAKDGPLYAEPRFGAAVTAQVKEGTSGDAIAKQSPWVNVKTSNGAGWIMSVYVRYAPGTGAAPARPTSSASTGRATSTLGIRGFDPVDLAKGQLNQGQLAQLDGNAASQSDAASAAQNTGLRATRVDYF